MSDAHLLKNIKNNVLNIKLKSKKIENEINQTDMLINLCINNNLKSTNIKIINIMFDLKIFYQLNKLITNFIISIFNSNNIVKDVYVLELKTLLIFYLKDNFKKIKHSFYKEFFLTLLNTLEKDCSTFYKMVELKKQHNLIYKQLTNNALLK